MKYKSTRGGVSNIAFKEAVMMGLAADGGLLIPEYVPDISSQLSGWQTLSYLELAFEIMSKFISDIDEDTLRGIIERSYARFEEPQVTPLRPLGDIALLELYHGPTLAFKDIALQFLGNIFEVILKETNTRINILGATSGDTGSAAIAGVQGKKNINIFIMFPEGKTSSIQELQMTSVLDDNVHNMAVEGNFDDCQTMLKTIFSDLAFKEMYSLAAVNSVNWARILAQIVYYFSAYYQLGMPQAFDVCVPTGNFGNIFAGYVAKKMGLPIRRLLLATNSNDILARFFNSGIYARRDVYCTHSPAMDIQVASNFERYLYYKLADNPGKVREFMTNFLQQGNAALRFNATSFDDTFRAETVSNEATINTIIKCYQTTGVIVDPHTAIGLTVAEQFLNPAIPMVSLATAHPAKFVEVMQKALPEQMMSHPALVRLQGLTTRKTVMPANVEAVKALIRRCV